MGAALRVTRRGGVLVAVVLACSGCIGGGQDTGAQGSPADSPVSAEATVLGDCVSADHVDIARDGVISAGPFKSNRGHWQNATGTKLWVRTSVDQPRTSATLRAAPVTAAARPAPVEQTRGPDQIATLDGKDSSGLFYPGAFGPLRSGTWHLTVTIGKDSGCFEFTTTR